MISTVLDRLRRLVRQPAFIVFARLAECVPGRPVQLARLFELRLDKPRLRRVRPFGTVRRGVPSDAEAMSRLEPKPDHVFVRRFAAGEKCVLVLDGEEIVGYAWFSEKPMHTEDRFRYSFAIPRDAIYGYDAFVRPEYRIRGIWPLLEKQLWEAADQAGRDSVFTLVDYGNDASLKSHIRLGYRVVRIVTLVRIGWRRWFFEARRPPGVYLQSTRPRPVRSNRS